MPPLLARVRGTSRAHTEGYLIPFPKGIPLHFSLVPMYLIHHCVVPLCPDHYRVVSYRKLRLLCSLAFVGLRSRKRYSIVSASLAQGDHLIHHVVVPLPQGEGLFNLHLRASLGVGYRAKTA